VKLFAAADGELDLDQSIFKIEPGRDEGEAALLGGAQELFDFGAVQQKLATAHGFVIHDVAVGVLADVGVDEPGFGAALGSGELAESVFKLDFAVASGLHLGSGENQTGFEAVGEVVVVSRGAVVAEDFDARFHARNPNSVNSFGRLRPKASLSRLRP